MRLLLISLFIVIGILVFLIKLCRRRKNVQEDQVSEAEMWKDSMP